jgi:hypothetical protein
VRPDDADACVAVNDGLALMLLTLTVRPLMRLR